MSTKVIGGALVVVGLAVGLWAAGGPRPERPTEPAPAGARSTHPAGDEWVRAAPVPRDDLRGEGRIALWREGRPIAIVPGTKGTTSLGKEFEGKRGSLRLGPDGKFLVYIANRTTVRPADPTKQDKVSLRAGKDTKEIETGVCLCHAFWGGDGLVYGHGLVLPERGDPEPPVDLTTDFVNWSFDPRTGKTKALKLPGNVSVLDISPDRKMFLILQYEKPAGAAGDYRLGLIPADGGEFIPLTKFQESTPGDFRFSPDGRSALGRMYRTEGNFVFPELILFDLKTRVRTVVAVPKDARVSASCWSPDGKRIAFVWESQAAFAERNKDLPAPVFPGQEKKPEFTVTVARPDGSEAEAIYTETEYLCGSIDWR